MVEKRWLSRLRVLDACSNGVTSDSEPRLIFHLLPAFAHSQESVTTRRSYYRPALQQFLSFTEMRKLLDTHSTEDVVHSDKQDGLS